MDKPAEPRPRFASGPVKQMRVYISCVLVGFIFGLALGGIPWLRSGRSLESTERLLRRSSIELHLAGAAAMARHGDYAAARDAASRFFTDVRAWLEDGEGLTPAEQAHLRSVLAERDALITLLARSDPAGAERTTTMYVGYRNVFPH